MKTRDLTAEEMATLTRAIFDHHSLPVPPQRSSARPAGVQPTIISPLDRERAERRALLVGAGLATIAWIAVILFALSNH